MPELDLGRVTGKSAYEYAAEGGYEGTEAAFQALMGTGPWVPKAGFVPASNRNLLDNGYFGPGVICQAGNTTVTSYGKGKLVDRWTVDPYSPGSASITNDGLHIVPGNNSGKKYALIEQNSERDLVYNFRPGETVILTVLLSDGNLLSGRGTVPVDWLDAYNKFIMFAPDINSGNIDVVTFNTWTDATYGYLRTRFSFRSEITILAVKLEVGTEQTLARQDASGGWVLNDPPPNPALELIKCMRYQQVLNSSKVNYAHFGMGLAISETEIRIVHQMQIPLRTDPTLTAAGKFKVRPNMANPPIEVSSVLGAYQSPQSIVIRALAPVTAGNWYDLRPDPDDIGRIILDANL